MRLRVYCTMLLLVAASCERQDRQAGRSPQAFSGALPAERAGDLSEADPFSVARVQSPHPDIFVREERLQAYAPSTGYDDGRVLKRLSVVSKTDQRLLLDRIYGSGTGALEDSFERYCWQDVTGDGKPELLLWESDTSTRHWRSSLSVYQLRPRRPGEFADRMPPTALVRVFSNAYVYTTWQTYPTTRNMIGTFAFDRGEDGVPAIAWSPSKDNQEKLDIVRWTWDAEKAIFVHSSPSE